MQYRCIKQFCSRLGQRISFLIHSHYFFLKSYTNNEISQVNAINLILFFNRRKIVRFQKHQNSRQHLSREHPFEIGTRRRVFQAVKLGGTAGCTGAHTPYISLINHRSSVPRECFNGPLRNAKLPSSIWRYWKFKLLRLRGTRKSSPTVKNIALPYQFSR